MSRLLPTLLASACLLVAPVVAAQVAPADAPAPAPEKAVDPAEPTTMPKGLSMPAPPYAKAEFDAGHEGKVELQLRIGTDGRVREAGVAKSSGWPVLDAQAVETAKSWTFSPALDAAGAPMESVVRVPIGFSGAGGSSSRAFGTSDPAAIGEAVKQAEAFSCAAFVADVDARGLTGKEKGTAGQPQYTALVGIYFIAAMTGTPDAGMNFVKRLPTLFPETVARCRAAPERTLGDAFKESVRSGK
jgi:TonB family protein